MIKYLEQWVEKKEILKLSLQDNCGDKGKFGDMFSTLQNWTNRVFENSFRALRWPFPAEGPIGARNLPCIEGNKVEFEDGVLTVMVPKSEPTKPWTHEVKIAKA